jgi:MarR family transcriptional regulator, lower aerobic nicotinate degradation pathway regulator
MKYGLLNQLLPLLEAFERAFPGEQDPQRFAVWLMAQQPAVEETTPSDIATSRQESEASALVRLLAFLHRYARLYARKGLEATNLGSLEEYAYLDTLRQSGPISKTELIQKNRHEKPTGMEIIRRLLDLGLMLQQDDRDDRRSKLVSLSPQGIELLDTLTETMQKIFRLTTGNLSAVERLQLLQLLEKLERFHQVVQARLKTNK